MSAAVQHGHCLRGAVTVSACAADQMSACFREMCARLTRIVCAVRKPDGWDFAGMLHRVSREDYETSNPFVREGEMP